MHSTKYLRIARGRGKVHHNRNEDYEPETTKISIYSSGVVIYQRATDGKPIYTHLSQCTVVMETIED